MKIDLIEIANVPYRNNIAKNYSKKTKYRNKIKSIILSIAIGLIVSIFISYFQIKSYAAEIIQPRFVEMTYYLPTGNNCANGMKPHEGIVAFASEYIGNTALIYKNNDGKVGDLIGIYEIYDTGYGKSMQDGSGTIEVGKTIDVFFENDIVGKEFIKLYGNKVYIQIVEAKG